MRARRDSPIELAQAAQGSSADLPPALDARRARLEALGYEVFSGDYPAEKPTLMANRRLGWPIAVGHPVVAIQGANTMVMPSTHHPYGFRYALDLSPPEVAFQQRQDLPNSLEIVAAHEGEAFLLPDLPTHGFGLSVLLGHGNGYASFYAHLEGHQIHDGQSVTVGEPIGHMGATGSDDWVPHLHFQVFALSDWSAASLIQALGAFDAYDRSTHFDFDFSGEPFSFTLNQPQGARETHLFDFKHTEYGTLLEDGHAYVSRAK